MKQYVKKLSKIKERFDSFNSGYFTSGLTAVFVGVFFLSVFYIDRDFSKRGLDQQGDSPQILEIYSLDTSILDIPTKFIAETTPIPIHIIDIKSNLTPPTITYSKVGETVQFNNLTEKDIIVESVQGESLKLEIPYGTNASTTFYETGIFYYKISDDRVGQIFIEE
ncbi:MAG: hypothetical protein O2871_02320 [bacterium]|nr:hypothetical protein [bacterium]